MRVIKVRFAKEVEFARDVSRIAFDNGMELRGPAFPDGAEVRLSLLGDSFIAVLLKSRMPKVVPSRAILVPTTRVEDIRVEPDDLELAMMMADENDGKRKR